MPPHLRCGGRLAPFSVSGIEIRLSRGTSQLVLDVDQLTDLRDELSAELDNIGPEL